MIAKALKDPKRNDKILSNIQSMADNLKELKTDFEQNGCIQDVFSKADDNRFRPVSKAYCAVPPRFVYRCLEPEYVIKTIENDKIRYSRPVNFNDKKDPDLASLRNSNRKVFSESAIKAFMDEVEKKKDISDDDKHKVRENLHSFKSYYDDIYGNLHICCFTDDVAADSKDDEDSRWAGKQFRTAALCIESEGIPSLHKIYYSSKIRMKGKKKRLEKMFIKGRFREFEGFYYDSMADFLARIYIKQRKYSWEHEWRSSIIGTLDPECFAIEDDGYAHLYYQGINEWIRHVIIGCNTSDSDKAKIITLCEEYGFGFCLMNEDYLISPIVGHETICDNCELRSDRCALAYKSNK
ncbi:hypothetical protein PED39_02450 [Methanomassiliicoccales archaeon LGM-RCC1]|nr:hypothetical protein PED39_02450 [Methanomassiliicoccales archaeon LGM-RCC1]